jgi:DNA adenine methylase
MENIRSAHTWAIYVLSHQSFYSILDSTWKCSKNRSTASQ